MLFDYFRRRGLLTIVKLMNPVLRKGYGSRDYFSAGQVEQGASQVRLSPRQKRWAEALYTENVDDADRARIRELLFGGHAYCAKDVLALGQSGRWGGGKMQDDTAHWHGMNSRF